jgi:hypothetical protein
MTEAEWLVCTTPDLMLEHLKYLEGWEGRAIDRKLRFLSAACCRRIWDLIPEASRVAVDATELFAERRIGRDELTKVFIPAESPADGLVNHAARAAEGLVDLEAGWPPSPLNSTSNAARRARWGARDNNREGEPEAQCGLLRCIFGNPCRPVLLKPSWQTPAVVALAQTAYDERILPAGTLDPDHLAVLSDALEEAGCDSADLLAHLRGPGTHVRGCWVVDLLLGKE